MCSPSPVWIYKAAFNKVPSSFFRLFFPLSSSTFGLAGFYYRGGELLRGESAYRGAAIHYRGVGTSWGGFGSDSWRYDCVLLSRANARNFSRLFFFFFKILVWQKKKNGATSFAAALRNVTNTTSLVTMDLDNWLTFQASSINVMDFAFEFTIISNAVLLPLATWRRVNLWVLISLIYELNTESSSQKLALHVYYKCIVWNTLCKS